MNIQANNKNIEVEVPEGYKKTPVGMIPEDWEVSKLEQVATIQNGRGYSHLNDGEIPVYASGGIINYVDDYLNEGESVGIGRKGTIDKPQLLKGKYWVVDTLFYINEFKNVLPYFLYSQFAQVNWYKYNESSGLPSLIKNTIKKIPLAIPPLPEQKAIADCLSTWDKGIEKLSALIASKKEQKKGLMQQLLTGKKRLKGFTEEWKEMRLGDIAYITTGASNKQDAGDGFKYVFFDRSSDVLTSKIFLYDCEAIIVPGEGADFIPKYFVGKFDLHQRAYAIMDFKNVLGKYIFYYLINDRKHLHRQAVGSTVKSLRLPYFKNMPMRIPSFEEQTAIANILQTADKEIELLEKKLEAFKIQKKGLMQVLLTGTKRLV